MFSLVSLALAASLALAKESVHPKVLDVWAPRVYRPNGHTVWYAGNNYNVTWDASNPPDEITNPRGKIYLVQNNIILFNYELADGFNLTDGTVEVQAPDVETGLYQVVLFGDSGDFSDPFTISDSL